jgi:ubiquinone/menaquinone biosynthesis C-methylase UbiE
VQVRRDFDEIYRTEEDPWNIGQAGDARYDLYHELILRHSRSHSRILDVGCGFGAFLARFQGEFEELVGLEVSAEAIEAGRKRFPSINFVQGSAGALGDAILGDERHDAIVYSDVIYYLDEGARDRSLRSIGELLSDDGIAFVAAWCPGGNYLEPDELRRLFERYFTVEDERLLESGHAVFVGQKKRFLVALTTDYETWQPVPPGRTIDWEQDVFGPTERLLDACDIEEARLTLMAEVGEYLWLREHEPGLATRMAEQWRDAVRRGHDVQLHLHPNWLPELGARRRDGAFTWDDSFSKIDDYPGNLMELIARCKHALEDAIRPVEPEYEVVAYRAGAYEAQPFRRLYDALVANNIVCDSSVYSGGRREGRTYDYTLAYSSGQPYFASRFDPQLKAPPSEQVLVELPVLTFGPGDRWTFDGPEGRTFAPRLADLLAKRGQGAESTEWYRRKKRLKGGLATAYALARPARRWLNRMVPRRVTHLVTSYEPERLVGHDYFVLIGHSKADLDVEAIRAGLRALRTGTDIEFVTLADMARSARAELARMPETGPRKEAERQVKREYAAVLGTERNDAQSHYLQNLIPLDRTRVLDLGCGAGDWADRIARLYPWMTVTGIDVGVDFVAEARRRFSSERVSFEVADFLQLPFDDGAFDCVYADNTLEHAWDVQATLREVHRVLTVDGALVAAIPSDARNPSRITDNHTWKTAPHDVRARLEDAGFVDIELQEVDTLRLLAMPPYPPADDRMMYVRAWKRDRPLSKLARAEQAMRHVHAALRPDASYEGTDVVEVLESGQALCWGYALALGEMLRREGYDVRWISMLAENHPRGRGERRQDSHEVVEVTVDDGLRRVLDPMSGVLFESSIEELLVTPEQADIPRTRDERYVARNYDLYSTSFWYSKVTKVAVRRDPRQEPRYVDVQAVSRSH